MRKKIGTLFGLLSLSLLIGCPQDTASGKPRLTSVVPNVLATGSADTEVHLIGTGFKQPITAVLQEGFNYPLSTQFVDSTDAFATVPASLLVNAASAKIFAQVGSNQQATQSLTITISNVAPTLTGMAPMHALVGAAPVTVTLTGTNFNSTSVVEWNGNALATTLVSATSLTAVIPTADFSTAGTDPVKVVNGGTGGGTSASLSFTVVAQLAITTTSLPGGSLNTPYSAALAATGGTTPYTWSLASGSLPVGLTLNGSTGVISGTPTAAGTATFTVQVVDSTGSLARRKF